MPQLSVRGDLSRLTDDVEAFGGSRRAHDSNEKRSIAVLVMDVGGHAGIAGAVSLKTGCAQTARKFHLAEKNRGLH